MCEFGYQKKRMGELLGVARTDRVSRRGVCLTGATGLAALALGQSNFAPRYKMNNILVDYWKPKGDDVHEMRKYEVGFYTKFDSREPLERFDNPIMGQRVPIHHVRLGPVPRVYTPDRVIAMGFKRNLLPVEVIGDRAFFATQSIESTRAIVRPGQTNYENSIIRGRGDRFIFLPEK